MKYVRFNWCASLLSGHFALMCAVMTGKCHGPGNHALKSGLRYWRGCGIRLQLAGKLLLQQLDRVVVEPCHAPEQVDVIRRRVEDATGAR